MAYDLARITKEFHEICEKAGVDAGFNIPIKLNDRLTHTLGRVRQEYDPFSERYIATFVEFSKQLIETATDQSIRDVILHEAAHVIVTERTGESHGHDALFKAVCAEIGTTNSGTNTEVERTVADSKIYKYSVYCPTCQKNIAGYSRMCKTLRNIDFCTCKDCGNSGLQVITNW